VPGAAPPAPPRVALCHEWLAERRGSEKTFEAMAAALPGADLYALTQERGLPFAFGGRQPHTTFLDRLPFPSGSRQLQLPLMPLAWRYVTRRPYDVVVTSSHACAKGFWPGRAALHLSYCYTPMRYVWLPGVDQRTPQDRLSALPRRVMRAWDRRSVRWVDDFAAISSAVQARIERFYQRSSDVIHPPVDTDFFTVSPDLARGDFVLAVSRMVAYKRLDLAIRACHDLDYPLVVAGAGPEEARLRALAAQLGAAVTFVVSPPDAHLRELYRTARAMVFPGTEDFGIVLVEAQACGTPVVAFGEGGSRDIVVPDLTGSLVPEQSVAGLRSGLERVLESPPDPSACRRNAERFSTHEFVRRFLGWVGSAAAGRGIALNLEPAGLINR
jgi:glycosyltransferase involved in cell wall biosynthesis